MMAKTRLRGALLALGLLPLLAVAAFAKPPDIWFNPLSANRSPTGKGLEYTEHDFPALMKPGAPWQNANAHVAVLGLPGNVVWSYPDLPGLVNFVHQQHWQFALAVGVGYSGGVCTKPFEGVSLDTDYAHEAVHVAQKWHQAGGRLDYVIMDAPFHFMHYNGPDCQFSIADAARRAATTMRLVMAEFPNAKIVDAEGPAREANDAWFADMSTWMQDFKADSGHAITVIGLDLHWNDPRPGNSWQDTARASATYFHKLGIQVGLNINADGGKKNPVTNAEWMAQNRQHIREALAANLGVDFYHYAQWMHHVELNLPETDPMAYTSLVDDAVAAMAAAGVH